MNSKKLKKYQKNFNQQQIKITKNPNLKNQKKMNIKNRNRNMQEETCMKVLNF